MTPIIEKIRKLRALAQSDNVNEAAAAAAAAERLIQEHNFSEAELQSPDTDEAILSDHLDMGARVAGWKSILLRALADAYQCAGVLNRRTQRYIFYGRPKDIETFRYQYAFFTVEIERLAQRHTKGKGRGYAASFRLGAAVAICDALRETTREARNVATSSALAVVDNRAAAARQRMLSQHTRLRSGGRVGASDTRAYEAGKQAGAGINRHTAIGAGGIRLLAG
jgi:hypothetical protein